jgi:hypothetical protein
MSARGLATGTGLDPGRLLLAGAVTPGRALLGDDPALGLVPPAIPPVLLMEPVDTFLAVDAAGRRRELRTELLVQQGFQRFGPDTGTVGELSGWTLSAFPGRMLLCDGTGEVWAHTDVRPSRAWRSAADAYERVLVVYGTFVGVRAPRGVPAAQYAPAHRAAELQTGRARGLVAAAVVTWPRP